MIGNEASTTLDVAPPTAPDLLPAVLLVLTATTGLVDAVSILGFGHVFTANMTGNITFLGFAAAGATGFSAARCAWALAGFLLGAVIGGRLAAAMAGRTKRRWLVTTASIECALFLAAAVIAAQYDPAQLVPAWRLVALLTITACAMGVRNATVRRLGIADLTTTVLTLTLTGLGADSPIAGGTSPRWKRRAVSVAAMFAGAASGAWLVQRDGLVAPLALTGLVVLVATLAYASSPASLHAASSAA